MIYLQNLPIISNIFRFPQNATDAFSNVLEIAGRECYDAGTGAAETDSSGRGSMLVLFFHGVKSLKDI